MQQSGQLSRERLKVKGRTREDREREGPIHFIPSSQADERAKNDFTNTARLVCVGYDVTTAVPVLESWMKNGESK